MIKTIYNYFIIFLIFAPQLISQEAEEKQEGHINNNKFNFDIDDKTNTDIDNQNNLIKNLSYFSKDNLGTEYIIESKYSEFTL